MTGLLGIDIGGSSSTIVLSAGGLTRSCDGPRVSVRQDGSGIALLTSELLARARSAWPGEVARITAIGVGATGLATLARDHDALASRVASDASELFSAGRIRVGLAIDAVTAHYGALAGRDGAVVSVGTGAIALGRHQGAWRRVDGWGHLLGDRGGAAWIGAHALHAALEQFDGVSADAPQLLRAAKEMFGPPHTWPAQLYTRDDRAGVLAEFAPVVSGLASGDPVSHGIMRRAAHEAARSALAALHPDQAPTVSATGGLFSSAQYRNDFTAALRSLRGDVDYLAAERAAVHGAVLFAAEVNRGTVVSDPPYVWVSRERA